VKPTVNDNSRRSAVKTLFASIAAVTAGLFGTTRVKAAEAAPAGTLHIAETGQETKPAQDAPKQAPLFSSVVVHGGLVYVSGKGEHGPGDITTHTVSVLDQIEAELKKAGSSMDKVLKVNVYLHDIRDYDAMNDAYRGRFGDKPPVRTTVACYGGIPGRSLVEIDAIAAL
jgi:2-iminobutanoate/2-iminopropanoate deaminase